MSSEFIAWKCIKCHGDIYTTASNAGTSIRCRDCNTLQVVPSVSGGAPSDISLGEKIARGAAENWQQYQGKGGCFIATELYGADAPEVVILRQFRDQVLLKRWSGRVFVANYYRFSPLMVPVLRRSRWIRGNVHKLVAYLVRRAHRTLSTTGCDK